MDFFLIFFDEKPKSTRIFYLSGGMEALKMSYKGLWRVNFKDTQFSKLVQMRFVISPKVQRFLAILKFKPWQERMSEI